MTIQCAGTTMLGNNCESQSSKDSDYCWRHEPEGNPAPINKKSTIPTKTALLSASVVTAFKCPHCGRLTEI